MLIQSIDMVKIQIFGIILLIVVVLIADLHAETTDNTSNLKNGRADISWPCTAKCAAWWKCRNIRLLLKKCSKPAGCNCSQFAWEG